MFLSPFLEGAVSHHPLAFAQDFPQLGTVDAYAKAQRSPLFFLQLAAPLWMAATIGEESLRQTLEDYRNQEATMQADGVPLLRVALHTPVIYKSPQKGAGLRISLSLPLS